jgi:hypothetical protein
MLVGSWFLTTLSTIFQLDHVSIGKDKKKWVLVIFSTCSLHFASWDNVTHKCLWLEIFDINLQLNEVHNVCQWLATGRWISPVSPVASTNKTDHHGITEILLKVALNTTKQTSNNIIQRDHLIPSTNTVWYE